MDFFFSLNLPFSFAKFTTELKWRTQFRIFSWNIPYTHSNKVKFFLSFWQNCWSFIVIHSNLRLHSNTSKWLLYVIIQNPTITINLALLFFSFYGQNFTNKSTSFLLFLFYSLFFLFCRLYLILFFSDRIVCVLFLFVLVYFHLVASFIVYTNVLVKV